MFEADSLLDRRTAICANRSQGYSPKRTPVQDNKDIVDVDWAYFSKT